MIEDEAVYEAVLTAIRDGYRACILTVVEVQGSAPRAAGAKMLVRADGSTVGTIGGGGMEAAAIRDARSALEEGSSRLVEYSLLGETADDLGACGGTAKVFLDAIGSRRTLLVAGAGHVAQPLVAIAALVGFRTIVVDDRPDLLTRARFPASDALVCAPFEDFRQQVTVDSRTAVVIVTRGHEHDAKVLRQVVDAPAWYIGMIGSRRKTQAVFDQLQAEGIAPERLARVHSPIGLRTGGQTPAEIALGIVAELLLVQYGGDGEPCSWRDNPLRGGSDTPTVRSTPH